MGRRYAHVLAAIPLLLTGACQTGLSAIDAPHRPVSLPAAYRDLPVPPPGTPIESGSRTVLDPRQQEAVVTGVAKWMKEPNSVRFGSMTGARNRFGVVTVCGEVDGRNEAGRQVGMRPYIGVLLGTAATPEFVVVGFGGTAAERSEIAALCRDSGAA